MENSRIENPYLTARREWNERYGEFVKSSTFWMRVALCSLGIASVSVIGLVYIGSQSKLVPYVMKEDESGRITSVGFPDKKMVDERVVRANLSEWVGWHRSVVADPNVQRLYAEKAYAFLLQGSPAKASLDQWYMDGHDPFVRMQTGMVNVQVQSVLALSDKTFQIEWTETSISKNGQPVGQAKYRALVTIESREVDSVTVLKNPLGIFLQTISIQQIGG